MGAVVLTQAPCCVAGACSSWLPNLESLLQLHLPCPVLPGPKLALCVFVALIHLLSLLFSHCPQILCPLFPFLSPWLFSFWIRIECKLAWSVLRCFLGTTHDLCKGERFVVRRESCSLYESSYVTLFFFLCWILQFLNLSLSECLHLLAILFHCYNMDDMIIILMLCQIFSKKLVSWNKNRRKQEKTHICTRWALWTLGTEDRTSASVIYIVDKQS